MPRRHVRAAALFLVPLLGAAAPARTQEPDPTMLEAPREVSLGQRASRITLGVHGAMAFPTGEFGRNVSNAFGVLVDGRYHLDRVGIVALRADAGWAAYGRGETSLPRRGRFDTDRGWTMSQYALGLVGLEAAVPVGPVRPYVHGGVGGAWFHTSVDRADGWGDDWYPPDTRGVGPDDLVGMRVLGIGLRTATREPVRRGALLLDVGLRRLWGGTASYVVGRDIRTGSGGWPTASPRRSRTDQWLLTIGMTLAR